VNEVDGRILNAEPSPDDPRDVPFLGNVARGLPPLELPTRFRRSGLGPVLNQHKTGTCGGHAGIGLRGWQETLEGHEITDFDPFRLYDLCLKADGHSDPDRMTGTTARTVLNVLKKTGTPLKDGGLAGKIAAYESIANPSEEAIKEAILTNGVLLVRCDWDAAWGQSALLPGRIVPAPSETMGGHIFLLFGWDDEVNGGSFLMRNSWGPWFPKKGAAPAPTQKQAGPGNAYLAYRFFLAKKPEAWVSTDVLRGPIPPG
jgi:hypothetical protein